MNKRVITAVSVLISLALSSCASFEAPDTSGNAETQNNATSATAVTTTAAETSAPETTAEVSEAETEIQSASAEPETSDNGSDGYDFDMTEDYVELNDRFYYCYINKLIRFDNKEIPYEEFLSYQSPYDEYITLFYDDRSGYFSVADTAAFAIRYACENNIEYLDFPIEYDTYTLNEAWEYARMTFPNLPLETINSQFEISNDGRYRIHFTKALLNIAGSSETLEAAKKIVSEMPGTNRTDAQKAYYLYDWVCKNVVYDEYHTKGREGRVNGAPQSAYGAIVEKRAVCDGIAGAIQLLYSIAGIECGKVDSFDYNGGAGHVWNVAEIDGEIWDFDATWDISRCYKSKDDTITEETGSGYYKWFGVERTAKTSQLDINDMMSEFGIFTESEYTEKSPVNMSYDIVVSTDPETWEETYYMNGKEVKELDYDYIIDETEKGNLVSIKFNDPITLADYWSYFTDSSSEIIDFKDYSGFPDTNLLAIEVYPIDYYD